MAAAARAYAAPTQTNLSPPLRSCVIVGSAVETAVMSRALRTLHTMTAVKDSQNAAPLPAGLWGGVTGRTLGGEEEDITTHYE